MRDATCISHSLRVLVGHASAHSGVLLPVLVVSILADGRSSLSDDPCSSFVSGQRQSDSQKPTDSLEPLALKSSSKISRNALQFFRCLEASLILATSFCTRGDNLFTSKMSFLVNGQQCSIYHGQVAYALKLYAKASDNLVLSDETIGCIIGFIRSGIGSPPISYHDLVTSFQRSHPAESAMVTSDSTYWGTKSRQIYRSWMDASA